MYDQDYAAKAKRKRIGNTESTECLLCVHYANTGSQFEWPCLILKSWICETHCAEVQMVDYVDTRKLIAKLFKDKIGSKTESELLNICMDCPYADR